MAFKRPLMMSIIILAMVVALVGCQSRQESKGTQSSKVDNTTATQQAKSDRGETQKSEPYKIGVILTKSGSGGWLGEAEEKAINFLVEKTNKEGGINGHPVEVVTYDDEGRAENATRYFKRLVESDKVIGVVGPSLTPTTIAITPLAIADKVPAVAMTGGVVPKPEDKWIFASVHPSKLAFEVAFKHFQQSKVTKIARLTPNDPLGKLGHDLTEQLAPKYGMEIVGTEYFNLGDVDVKAQLARLKATGAQVLVSYSSGDPAAMVSKQVAEMGWKVPVLVTYANSNRPFIKMAGDKATTFTMGGKVVVADELSASDPMQPVIKEYVDWHKAKYSEPPLGMMDGFGYDAFNIILAGIKNSGKGPEELKSDPEALRTGIVSIKNLISLNGIFNMSPTDHVGLTADDLIPMEVNNGKWVVVK